MLRTPRTDLTRLLSTMALFAAGLLALVPFSARAQTVPVEPYYVVTIADDVPLKAGDMNNYYHVALLERGRVLRVDAEGGGWARVAYPPDLPVYVRAEEVQTEPGGKYVVLTRESGLKSVNQAGGFGKSWQRALPRGENAPIGTRLRVYAAIEDVNDAVIGYSVVPPEAARAYVKVGSLRAATDAEVKAYLDSIPQAEPDEADTTEPVAEETTPAETPADDNAVSNGDTPPVEPVTEPGENDNADIDLRNPPAAQPETTTQPEQPANDDGDPAEADDGVTHIEQGNDDAHARLVGTLQQLSELFAQVQKQDSDTAELDEMAAELRRAIAAQGDDTIGQRIAAALQQRLQLIEMRITARDSRRELRAKREAIDASFTQIATRIRELETTRGYQFVGRLVRSSVYDGNRLPLMYRIVSVNESVPRTIGYIVPGNSSIDVTGKLGEIVGVLGTSTLDRDLNLRIVTPTRVDTLGPEGLGVPGDVPGS